MTTSFLAKSELFATLEKGNITCRTEIINSKCEWLQGSDGNRDAGARQESTVVMMPVAHTNTEVGQTHL